MRYLSVIAALLSLTLVACGDDDDGPGGIACDIEILSVTPEPNGNFTIRTRNNTSAEGQVSFDVIYAEGGIQNGDQGIGVASNVGPGVTVDIETVGGVDPDEYDCASLRVTFISTQAGGIICDAVPVGDDCYN